MADKQSNSTKEFQVLNILFGIMLGLVAVISMAAAIRIAALIGTVWLVGLLVAPMVAVWMKDATKFHASLWCRIALAATMRRKTIGLWAAAWLTAHAGLSVSIYFGGFRRFATFNDWRPITVLEVVSLVILLLMAALSNQWSRQHVPGWRYIHLSVWALPGMVLASSIVAARDTLGQLPLFGVVPVLLAACLVGGVVSFIGNRQRHSADWARCGFLTAGCLAAIVALVAS